MKQFLNKVYTTPKYFYICCVVLVILIGCIIFIVNKIKPAPTNINSDVDIKTTQISALNLDKIIYAGNKTSLELLSECNVSGGVSVRYIVTLWGKENDILNSDPNNYVDCTGLLVSDLNGNEAEKKFYILDNSTTVSASKYSESDGEIIAVRYYLDSNLDFNFVNNEKYYLLDSYDISCLNENGAISPSSEILMTISTQATTYDVSLNNWTTVSDFSLSSMGYMGDPIDIENLSMDPEPAQTMYIDTATTELTPTETLYTDNPETVMNPETTLVPETIESETVIPEPETTTSKTENVTPETTTQQTELSSTQPESQPAETTDSRVFPVSMSISTGTLTLSPGQTHQILTTFEPANSTETMVTWLSSDPNVASVSQDGVVSALSPGHTTLTVASINGMTLTCSVDVNAPDPLPTETETSAPIEVLPDSISLSSEEITLRVGESSVLQAILSPENITNLTVDWYSTDASVASIVNGQVTALSSGTTFIYATTANGIQAVCTVKVFD